MELTELEGALLGVVAGRGPCSAYSVRQRFERSLTWGWSSSKGGIYPALKRLIARGLLSAAPSEEGQRSDQLELTQDGRQALIAWIEAISREMSGASVDPIRTRVNYLFALPPARRREFLERALAQVRSALDAARALHADEQGRDGWALAAGRLGLRMQLEAKLNWLQLLVADSVGGDDS